MSDNPLLPTEYLPPPSRVIEYVPTPKELAEIFPQLPDVYKCKADTCKAAIQAVKKEYAQPDPSYRLAVLKTTREIVAEVEFHKYTNLDGTAEWLYIGKVKAKHAGE